MGNNQNKIPDTYKKIPDGTTRCYICNNRYLTDYFRYHEDRCGIKVNGKRILGGVDKMKRIK